MLTAYQQTIHLLKYARWIPSEGRRETFEETNDRFRQYMLGKFPEHSDVIYEISLAIANQQLAPSMRLFATAGPAVEQENLMAYNCMFMTMDSWGKLGKLMYALMCGTGVGFSVETQYVSQMLIPGLTGDLVESTAASITVEDSRPGWAKAYTSLIVYLLARVIPKVNYSLIRPKGSPLKTTGGYASGPEPLQELFEYTISVFRTFVKQGYVRPIDIYDLCCRIADVVVQGGVRRSACIAIFSPEDGLMWESKQDCTDKPWRFNANNSVMFEDEAQASSRIHNILERAKVSGEPGVLIRSVLKRQMEACGREPSDIIGVNPCGEIILRDMQVCNLTEVVVRPEYSLEQLERLVELATIQGLFQATLTKSQIDLPWAQKEPLLGVSLTGLADDPVLMAGNCEALDWLRSVAHSVAAGCSEDLGLEVPKAITTVKPSGTVSKLMGCAPGIHPWYAKHMLNNISIPVSNPICNVLLASGSVPVRHRDERSIVFSFPVDAPDGSQVHTTALKQLDNWRKVRKHWADHNVSCTIYVSPDEWADVESWCKKNIGILSGITFISEYIPLTHVAYMPIEPLDSQMVPVGTVDWKKLLYLFDRESEITAAREFSCMGGQCSL